VCLLSNMCSASGGKFRPGCSTSSVARLALRSLIMSNADASQPPGRLARCGMAVNRFMKFDELDATMMQTPTCPKVSQGRHSVIALVNAHAGACSCVGWACMRCGLWGWHLLSGKQVIGSRTMIGESGATRGRTWLLLCQ